MISRILTIWLLVQESHAFSPHLLHRANGQGHRIQRVGQGLHAEPVSVNGSTSNSSESVSVVASNSKTIDKISTLMNTATATATNNLDAKASEITITSNNGTNNLAEDILAQVNTLESTFVSSPPLSFEKYLTMQEKRVLVTITYTSLHGLRPYYLTILKKIKESNPDVIVERIVLPHAQDDVFEDTVFEVMVDGKVVIGKSNSKYMAVRRSGNDEVANNKVFGMSVYVSMEDVNVAIGKARKKRRPSTSYTSKDREIAIRLEMLKSDEEFF